jgi:hypothetical protein
MEFLAVLLCALVVVAPIRVVRTHDWRGTVRHPGRCPSQVEFMNGF